MLINYASIYVNVIFYAKITILTCALVLDPGLPELTHQTHDPVILPGQWPGRVL
jgi:hypothetical protein